MNAAAADIAKDEKPTILVIEDNVELRFLISDTLRNDGFRVIESANAKQALEHLRTPHRVALVFADVALPGETNGIAFAHALERDHPEVKIILTSGSVSRDQVPPNLLLIRKPYILARVVWEVRHALGMEPKGAPPG